MTERRRTNRNNQHGGVRIPGESDWGDYHSDLDREWAHDQYCGRSNEEMQHYIGNNPIEAASDLRFMPEVPFRYYMLGYKDFVMSRDVEPDPNAASCFLDLVLQKLEEQPRHIAPIMPELLSALQYVGHHQIEFQAEESIYGSFLEKLRRIEGVYAEIKDRYRRYP